MDYSGWITDITPNPSGGNGGFGTGSGAPDPAWTSTLPNVALWTCLLRTIRRLCHHNPSICPCILINVYMTCALYISVLPGAQVQSIGRSPGGGRELRSYRPVVAVLPPVHERFPDPTPWCRKRCFVSRFVLTTIVSPRQARDKHEETLKKETVFFLQG